MKKSLYGIVICLILCNLSLCAQTNEQMSQAEINETIKQQCRHKLDALTYHLEKIASKLEDKDSKDYHIEACLDLFIGKGNGINDDENNMFIPAPKIEVSLMSTRRTVSYLIKHYLLRLKEIGYSKIAVKAISCYYLDRKSIKMVGENRYSAAFSVYKFSIGDNRDAIVYRDKIRKPVRIIIDTDQSCGIPDILLGDIKANQISELGQ